VLRGGGWLLSQLHFHDTFTWICLATMFGKNKQPTLPTGGLLMNESPGTIRKKITFSRAS